MSFKIRLLLLTFIWFFASSVAMTVMYQNQQIKVELRTKQSLHKDLAAHMRDDNPLMIGTDYNPVALKSIFHTLMLIGPDFEIYFLDASGNVTSHAAPKDAFVSKQISIEPIKAFIAGKPYPILGDDPRNPSGNKVFSVAPIKEFGSTVGYLYVVIGSEQHTSLINSETRTPLFWALMLGFVTIVGFSIVAYWLVKMSLLKPIEVVTKDLEQQADKDFRLSPNFINQVPELKPIAQHYQLAAKRIQQQFLQLEFQSSAQHSQLMQISHDLKTPLSSVLGYLETWRLQQQQPDPMIDVAYKNALKLSEQLQTQLNMAKQERLMPSYHQEPINLASLVEDVVEATKIELTKKHLTLVFDDKSYPTIEGDKLLLSRLFENLFENAIRHSPEGSAIELNVDVAKKDASLYITLINQTEDGSESGSLGIGVKIIKSILMLHHSALSTVQTKGMYQQSFRLPLCL